MEIHAKVLEIKPDAWRGNTPRENEIKRALLEILKDELEVERIFAIIERQSEY